MSVVDSVDINSIFPWNSHTLGFDEAIVNYKL